MINVIYDLDGTIIDSSHRYTALENGDIDLEQWIADNNAANCFKDSLLPLHRLMVNDNLTNDVNVIICTARVLSDFDYEYFKINNVPFDVMLDRPAGCTMPDADLKEIQLRLYAHQAGFSWGDFSKSSHFFEDNPSVIARMESIGIGCLNANHWNKLLS